MNKPVLFKPLLTLMLFLGLVLLSAHASAAIGSAGILDDVTGRFQRVASGWGAVMKARASWLFWLLVLLSMVWTFGMMALRKADIGELFAEFVRFAIFTGFFWWLLTNGPEFAISIMNSLRMIGAEASGLPNALSPSGIVDVGFDIFFKVVDQSSVWKPMDSLFGLLLSCAILIVFALVGVNMLLLIVSSWLLAYAGVFILGFGGSKWTSEMAVGYFKSVLNVALQLMSMILIIGIGKSFVDQYYTSMSAGLTLKEMAVMAVVAAILLFLVAKVPPQIGALAGGSTGSLGSNFGVGTAVAAAAMGAAAVASAGAAVAAGAANAAGGAQALMAAFSKAGAAEREGGSGGGGGSLMDAASGGGGGDSSGGGSALSDAMGDSQGGGAGSSGTGSGGGANSGVDESSSSSPGAGSASAAGGTSSGGPSSVNNAGTPNGNSSNDGKSAGAASSGKTGTGSNAIGGAGQAGGGSSGQASGGSSGGAGQAGGGSSGGTSQAGGGSSGGTSQAGGGSSGGTSQAGGGSSGGAGQAGGGSGGQASGGSSGGAGDKTDQASGDSESGGESGAAGDASVGSENGGESGAGSDGGASGEASGSNASDANPKTISSSGSRGGLAGSAGRILAGTAANLAQGAWDVARAKAVDMKTAAAQRIAETPGGKIAAAIKARQTAEGLESADDAAKFEGDSLSAGEISAEDEAEIAAFRDGKSQSS